MTSWSGAAGPVQVLGETGQDRGAPLHLPLPPATAPPLHTSTTSEQQRERKTRTHARTHAPTHTRTHTRAGTRGSPIAIPPYILRWVGGVWVVFGLSGCLWGVWVCGGGFGCVCGGVSGVSGCWVCALSGVGGVWVCGGRSWLFRFAYGCDGFCLAFIMGVGVYRCL